MKSIKLLLALLPFATQIEANPFLTRLRTAAMTKMIQTQAIKYALNPKPRIVKNSQEEALHNLKKEMQELANNLKYLRYLKYTACALTGGLIGNAIGYFNGANEVARLQKDYIQSLEKIKNLYYLHQKKSQ